MVGPRRPADSRPTGGGVPEISAPLLALFTRYAASYLRRHFHAVRCSKGGPPPAVPVDEPLVVYANHPAWWDPLVYLHLATTRFAGRRHYGPIDVAALGRYGLFRRLGFFGVERGSRSGARVFLSTSSAILARPATALWITPQGRFADPRERPLRLEPGLAALARRLGRGVFLPLAVEYPFWEQREPECLVRFGTPVRLGRDGSGGPDLDALLARRLEAAMDELAREACARDPDTFDTLLAGRAGVGGVYDLWRRLHAAVRGERFDPEHRS